MSTSLVAFIMMVTSQAVIIRVIKGSENWRTANGVQKRAQTRRNTVTVLLFYFHNSSHMANPEADLFLPDSYF